jgi:regulatory protein
MIITGIERQKKNPRRYSIFIDGEYVLGIDRNVLADNGLRKGDTVDRTLIERLRTEDEFARAYLTALRFLSYRPRSEAEIRQRLEREEISDMTTDRIVAKLFDERQLDDRRFAEMYAESKMLRKPIGARRLRRELRQKGIDEAIINAVERLYCSSENEIENARLLAEKKLAADRTADPLKKKRRLADFLARRGYDWEIIQTILKEYIDEQSRI